MGEPVETYEQGDTTGATNRDDAQPSVPNLRIVKADVKTNVDLAKDRLSELNEATTIPVVLQETQKHRDSVVKNLGETTKNLEKYKDILEQEEKKILPLRLLSTQRFKAKKYIPLLEESVHARTRLKGQFETEESQMKSELRNLEKEKEEKVYKDIENAVKNVLNDYVSLYNHLVDENTNMSELFSEHREKEMFSMVCRIMVRGEMGRTVRRFSDEIERGEYFPEQKEKVRNILEKAIKENPFEHEILKEEPYIEKLVSGNADRNETFVNVLNIIKENPQLQKILGEGVLSGFQEKVERIAFQGFLATERKGGKNNYINILMELKKKENIPHIIMGFWYGQKGHNNTYFNEEAEKTEGYKFISSLTTDELKSLKALEIPGLMEIVEIVKTNKDARLDKEENAPKNYAFTEIEENLTKMARHFFNNGQEGEKLFAWNFLKDLDNVKIETIADVLEQKLLNDSTKEEKEEMFKFLFYNISNTTDISVLPTNLQNFGSEYREMKKLFPEFEYKRCPLCLKELFAQNLDKWEIFKPGMYNYGEITHRKDVDVEGIKMFLKNAIKEESDFMTKYHCIAALIRTELFNTSDFDFLESNLREMRQQERVDKDLPPLKDSIDVMLLQIIIHLEPTLEISKLSPEYQTILLEYQKFKKNFPEFEYRNDFYHLEETEHYKNLGQKKHLNLKQSLINNMFSNWENSYWSSRHYQEDLTSFDAKRCAKLTEVVDFLSETISKESDLLTKLLALDRLLALAEHRTFAGLVQQGKIPMLDWGFLKKNLDEIETNEGKGELSNISVKNSLLRIITNLEPFLVMSELPEDMQTILATYRNFKKLNPNFSPDEIDRNFSNDIRDLKLSFLSYTRKNISKISNSQDIDREGSRTFLKNVIEVDTDFRESSIARKDALEILILGGFLDSSDYTFIKNELEENKGLSGVERATIITHIIDSLDKLPNHVGAANMLVEMGLLSQILKNAGKFNKLPPKIELAYEILGNAIDTENYQIICDLKENKVAEQIQGLVSKGGQHGIEQLREYLNSFKREIVSNDFNPQILLENPFLNKYYKGYIRFKPEDGSWGNRTDEGFRNMLNNYLNIQTEGKTITALDAEFSPSEIIPVLKTNQKDRENFQFPEDCVQVYNKFNDSLRQAFSMLEQTKPFSAIVDSIELKKERLLTELSEKSKKFAEEGQNIKAIENLNRQIGLLENLKPRKLSEFQSNFAFLSQYSEFHEELRQIVFLFALKKRRNARVGVQDHLQNDDITPEKATWMLDFVEHIVNQETFSNYFANKKEAKAFERIVNVDAISQVIAEINSSDKVTEDTLNLQFVPSRGLLLEFSGHTADACWASKHDSIAQKYPNITALTFIRHPGTKHESVAGATLLIKTKSKDDEPLLVIRGLNPIENVINSISREDFFKKLFEYLKDVAQKDGRKLAIVIEDRKGKSGTNRQAIHDYCENNFKNDSNRVILKSNDDTEFNNYPILDKCYLV